MSQRDPRLSKAPNVGQYLLVRDAGGRAMRSVIQMLDVHHQQIHMGQQLS